MKADYKIPFRINDKGLVEFEIDYRPSFRDWKELHKGKHGYLTYSIVESHAEFYQHKYYRGYLLDPYAAACYDGDTAKAHRELKEKYLFVECNDPAQVPKRVRARAREYYERFQVKETGQVLTMMVGYTPSTGDITRKEFRDYILKVEEFVRDKIAVTQEGLSWRIRAMGAPDDTSMLFVPEASGDAAASQIQPDEGRP